MKHMEVYENAIRGEIGDKHGMRIRDRRVLAHTLWRCIGHTLP